MSVKIRGPIGKENLISFSIATTFRAPRMPQANRQTARCKICGTGIPKGEGNEVWIVGVRTDSLSTYFLCSECFEIVNEAIEKDGRFRQEQGVRNVKDRR